MKNEIVVAAGAVPLTLFVLANIGSSTSEMTSGNAGAVKQSMGVAATAMVIAAAATGSVPAALATGLAVAASFWAMREVWAIPTVSDLSPI
jgi:hypothetical protein